MKNVCVLLAALFGLAAFAAPAADFNGDGYDDIAIFRPSNGLWAIRDQGRYYFGRDGDIPVPGKWTQDTHDEICVFRPSSSLWATRSGARAYYGTVGDIPIGASGASGGGDGLWSQIGSDIYYDSGYVGIGTTDPRFNLDIHQNSSYWSYLRFTNTTTGTGDYNGVLVGIDPGEDFRIHSYEANAIKFYVNDNSSPRFTIQSTGRVGIGTSDPYNKLHVKETTNWYPALFENTSGSTSSRVLNLRIDRATPGTNCEYIGFYKSSGQVGYITGNGAGGVQLTSLGSDFAEYLPRLNVEEEIDAGDLVGVQGGRISKDTARAEQVQVVSTGPIVAGNFPGKEREDLFEKVAFIGRAPAKVRGQVQLGDYIVPSGRNDGVGVAVSPDKLTSAHCARLVGRAWQSSEDEGVKLIDTSVGLQVSAQALGELVREKDQRIDRLTERVEVLERMIREGKQ